MFQFAASFNKNILEWDTGKVANSANMFKNATDWYKKFSCPNDSSVPNECSCTACVKQEEFLESIEECLRLAPGGIARKDRTAPFTCGRVPSDGHVVRV